MDIHNANQRKTGIMGAGKGAHHSELWLGTETAASQVRAPSLRPAPGQKSGMSSRPVVGRAERRKDQLQPGLSSLES